MTYFSIYIIIGLFTILPLIGVYVASGLWDLDTSGMFTANLIHVCIIFISAFLAIKKLKKVKCEWREEERPRQNVEKIFKLILSYSIFFSIIVFILYGRAIFSGVYRGDVRTSVGPFGWLVTFILGYAFPGMLSFATVIYFYHSDIFTRGRLRMTYYIILGLGVVFGLMSGGKSSVVTMMFPALIQYSQKLTIMKGFFIGILGALSIVLIGEKQMGQTFSDAVSYNIYRSTDLAGFGTACVWDKYPDGCPTAYLTIFNAFGENVTSIITGIDRHTKEFLKFNVARDVTFDYYKDPDGAITGSGNLTVTSFGEAVYWLGHDFFFIISIIAGVITYNLIILLYKTRRTNKLRSNTLVTIYFTSIYISWLNSTSGSLLSTFCGLTTLFYMLLLYLLLKHLEKRTKKKIYVKNSI